MKYFNPSYWFKMWLLSAPLFNSKSEGIYAKSIDNKKIKDWVSKNTTNISFLENQELNLSLWNTNLTTYNQHHKHRHQKSRNRYKRQNQPKIFQTTIILEISNNPIVFFNQLNQINSQLQRQNIIFHINENNSNINLPMFSFINQNSPYNYFTITVNLVNEENEITGSMRWVYRSIDLYLQGYIINHSYRYFSDASLQNVTNYINDVNNNINLNFDGNYISLEHSGNFNWERIVRDINNIYNNREVRNSIITIPLITSESMRFPTVQSAIRNSYNPNFIIDFDDLNRIQMVSNHYIPNYNHPNQIVAQGRNWDFFQPIVTNWDRSTQESAQFLRENSNTDIRNLVENFLSFLNNRNRVPINWSNPQPLRIMVAIFSWRFLEYLNQCNRRIKRMEELICYDQNWTNINKLTDYFLNNKGELYSLSTDEIKPNKVNIKGKVTTIQVLDENKKGKNLKVGDVYVGTTEGLYLIHRKDFVFKVNNIDDEISSISILKNNKNFVTTKKEEIFYINTDHINISYKDSVYAEGLFDSKIKSSNLEKEIKLYYLKSNNNWNMNFKPDVSTQNNYDKIDWNLKKINPVDNYEKLEFLGDVYSNGWGVKTQWGSWIYDGNPANHKPENTYDLDYFMKSRNNKFHKIIENTKSNDYSIDNSLQKFDDNYLSAKIAVHQRFGLTWYWEDDNYYLKIGASQYCNWWASESSLECSVKLGNGIRLYNDDTFETQISNPNDRKRREIFEEKNELKNVTKWTDEFTKSINHEQHLPIDNKPNFSTSNITSL
ncbi:ribosome-inactivating family protein [Spiroplasma endosymbiont of Apeira syringaria]|uniref:ribosome-inactivating family protein n=1 Tax=Spiroplasma endosymbiont of Apeira syringaria TaxID=3066307 RepID=UPI0030D37C55